MVSQVEVTASKPWQTPTVSFHLHGQRLRSGHPAYLAHCRPGKAEREKCWAQRRSELGPEKPSFAPSQSPSLSPAPYLPYCTAAGNCIAHTFQLRSQSPKFRVLKPPLEQDQSSLHLWMCFALKGIQTYIAYTIELVNNYQTF